jgi:hypothetical protein
MKYYSEDETKEIRAAFEREVFNWGQVSTKKMFGCPCYKVNNRLFAFLVTNGIVVTRLGQNEKEELSFKPGSTFFHTGKKYVKNWPQIPVRSIEELKTALPFVKESYKQALQGV